MHGHKHEILDLYYSSMNMTQLQMFLPSRAFWTISVNILRCCYMIKNGVIPFSKAVGESWIQLLWWGVNLDFGLYWHFQWSMVRNEDIGLRFDWLMEVFKWKDHYLPTCHNWMHVHSENQMLSENQWYIYWKRMSFSDATIDLPIG